MKGMLRSWKRVAAGIGLAGGLAALLLFVVVPAFASNAGDGVPPKSSQGIVPVDISIGGQGASTICAAMGSSGQYAYDIVNPAPGTYNTTAPDGTKIQIKLADPGKNAKLPAYSSDKYVGFTFKGGTVVDVGIKGGSDTTGYEYTRGGHLTYPPNGSVTNPVVGPVTSDDNMHAPAQSIDSKTGDPTQLYSLSHMTFCFNTTFSASGSVSLDGAGVSGWTVDLYDTSNNNAKVATTTGSGGSYTFSGLTSGHSYTVCTVPQGTVQETSPTSATPPCAGSESANGNSFTINNASVSGQDFAYTSLVSQTVTVFNDGNHNGSQDSGENGISPPDWTLTLYDSGNSQVGSPAVTSGGSYTWQSLSKGSSYKVCITSQTGWQQTTPSGSCITFTAGAGTPTVFGEAQLASIGGKAYYDPNGDGTNTSVANGLTVTLTKPGGGVETTTTAPGTGAYSFDNEFVNDNYTVCITPPSDNTYTETKPTSGATCSGEASVGYSVSPLSSPGPTNLDFGLQGYGSVSGTVYNDVDQSGSNNAGDTALQGWTVKLYDKDGNQVGTSKTTDGNGNYTFHTLFSAAAAPYLLCETAPSGTWAQSEPDPSKTDNCTGDLKKGRTFTPAGPGDTITGQNFGNVPAIPCAQPMTVTGDNGASYDVQLAACKDQTFVLSLTNGTVDNDSGTTNPSVSLWVGDQTGSKVPMVEKIVFPFAIQPGPTQPVLALHYDDTFPFYVSGVPAGAGNTPTMPFCNLDPRNGTELGLASPYITSTAGVMPSGATSCLIVQSQSAATGGNPLLGKYTAYVYSAVDGWRGTGP